MSVFGIEQALYDISTKRDVRKRFAEGPEEVLRRYPLDPEERSLIGSFEVGELYRRGVSPLLTMGFWQTSAPSPAMADYLVKMRGAPPAEDS